MLLKGNKMAKVAKKIEDMTVTPDGIIKSAMRLLFMRSRERSSAIRRDGNTCTCGSKGSSRKGAEVKTEVHHVKEGDINWERIYTVIREELLCSKEGMVTLCRPCHLKIHGRVAKKPAKEKKNGKAVIVSKVS